MYIDEVDKLTKKVIGQISSDLKIATTCNEIISISIPTCRLNAVRTVGMSLERGCSNHY